MLGQFGGHRSKVVTSLWRRRGDRIARLSTVLPGAGEARRACAGKSPDISSLCRIADDHDTVPAATTTKEVGIRAATAATTATTRSVSAVFADRI